MTQSLLQQRCRAHVPHRRLNRAHATFMPDTAWPRMQAPARLIPRQNPDPGFDAIPTLSTPPQWFTHVRLLGSHLTHLVRLSRSAHHPGSFTDAACGGLGPPPARAIPEAHLHHQCSTTPSSTIFYIAPSRHVRDARISAFLDCALRANSPGQGHDLVGDQIPQSYRYDRRSRPTTTAQRCRRSPPWMASSAPTSTGLCSGTVCHLPLCLAAAASICISMLAVVHQRALSPRQQRRLQRAATPTSPIRPLLWLNAVLDRRRMVTSWCGKPGRVCLTTLWNSAVAGNGTTTQTPA